MVGAMKGTGNAQRAQRVQERRRSGGHGTHRDRRTKRNRDKAAQKRNAIRDQRED